MVLIDFKHYKETYRDFEDYRTCSNYSASLKGSTTQADYLFSGAFSIQHPSKYDTPSRVMGFS